MAANEFKGLGLSPKELKNWRSSCTPFLDQHVDALRHLFVERKMQPTDAMKAIDYMSYHEAEGIAKDENTDRLQCSRGLLSFDV